MSGTMKFTDSPEQAAVIQAPSYEDVVVVAGAGSGKTYTMTRRIITLIEQGVSPEKILGLTFTRKAASELLSRVSAAVSRNQRERGLKTANMTFLKPEVSTYDAFFQSIVRQYGLLVGFDQNTQPLSEAGAMQLIHTVLDKHMVDLMAFDGDLKSFNTIAGNVFALSNAISGAMIGSGCTSFDEAVQRVRDWDEAFIRQVDKALDGETVPTEQPKSPKPPKRLKKDSDADYEKKLEKYRELGHSMCVYNSTRLASVAKQRNLLLDLVLDYHAEKRACNMAEFSDFTIAAFQLVSRFPSIGATYRKRYSHVLLDEYQDTSTTQAMVSSDCWPLRAPCANCAASQQAGLTTLVVGQAALLERPEVQDVFALLHVVSDHTDSAALMRLLATPRFAVEAARSTACTPLRLNLPSMSCSKSSRSMKSTRKTAFGTWSRYSRTMVRISAFDKPESEIVSLFSELLVFLESPEFIESPEFPAFAVVYSGDCIARLAEPACVHLMGGFAARRFRRERGGPRCARRRGVDDRAPVEGA